MMRKNKRDELLDAAIKSYAEYGEQGLTTKNLAKVADCSEALIYRHFKSKDDLLRECYLRLHARANQAFVTVDIPENLTLAEVIKRAREYYLDVVRFFVEAGYESLFYFWFRMSDAFTDLLKDGSEDVKKVYLSSFMNSFEQMRVRLKLNISADYYRTFIVFATGTFVEQIIKGKLPKTEESYEMVVDLVFGGLYKTLPGTSWDYLADVGNR